MRNQDDIMYNRAMVSDQVWLSTVLRPNTLGGVQLLKITMQVGDK